MKYMNNIGTGNSKVKVIYAYALRLNNTIIEKSRCLSSCGSTRMHIN